MHACALFLTLTSCLAFDAWAARIDISIPPIAYPGTQLGTVTADVDGDGRLDFIVATEGPGEFPPKGFTVHRNLGHGTLAPGIFNSVAREDEPLNIFPLRDLNGDGRPDLMAAVRGSPPALAIAINSGGGTFQAAELHRFQYKVLDVATGDLDGDARPDLAISTSSYLDGPLAIITLRNLGGGRFGSPVVYPWPGLPETPVALADLNLDGSLDVVTVGVYLPNQGNGSLGFPIPIGAAVDAGIPQNAAAAGYSMVVTDMNGDASMDVIVGATGSSNLSVALNRGGTHFDRTVYAAEIALPLRVSDLDQDGWLDIVVAGAGTCSTFFNNGTGSFSGVSYAGAGGDGEILIQDVDANGRSDIVVTGGSWLVPLLNRGGRSLHVGNPYGPFRRYWNGVFFDADDDGVSELLTTAGEGPGLLALRPLPNGDLTAPRLVLPASQDGGFAVADFDRDGILDILTRDGAVARGTGGGSFGTPVPRSWTGALGGCMATATGDLNQDGWPDATYARAGGVSVVVNESTRILQAPASNYLAGTSPTFVALGDFDSDGDLDLIANGWGSFLLLCWNGGAGQFGAPVYVNLGAGTPVSAVAADFDGDGTLDLAVARVDMLDLLLLNRGGGTFTQSELAGAGYSPALATADLDADGDMDLVGGVGSALIALRNDGAGNFNVAWDSYFGATPLAVCVGDFDREAGPDLMAFATNSNNNMHRVLLFANRGDGTFEPLENRSAVSRVAGCALGDFTGDGRLDVFAGGLLFENRTGGATSILAEDLGAAWSPQGVHLSWRLAPSTLHELRGVTVQRAASEQGPYASRHAVPLEPARDMGFDDGDITVGTAFWYRLLIGLADGTEVTSEPIGIGWPHDRPSTAIGSVGRQTSGGPVEIRYQLGVATGRVELGIYDVRGRRVWGLAHMGTSFAEYVQRWDGNTPDGTRVVRGVYLARLTAGGTESSKKFCFVE